MLNFLVGLPTEHVHRSGILLMGDYTVTLPFLLGIARFTAKTGRYGSVGSEICKQVVASANSLCAKYIIILTSVSTA